MLLLYGSESIMCAIDLLPFDADGNAKRGYCITFIVPAQAGCNLKCSFCFIRQRSAVLGNTLAARHYSDFISAAHNEERIYAISIQGYEPLLPEAQAYTRAIVATGASIGVPVNLVTNGTFLGDSVDWLAASTPATIAISLDAPSPEMHDSMRGVSGAWAATVRGIERANQVLAPQTKIAVASVLMPSGWGQLKKMPRLLRELGVERWILTPLMKVGSNRPGGPMSDKNTIYESLARLQDAADIVGIGLSLDDELDCLQHQLACVKQPELRRFQVRTIPCGVELVRLEPGGECVCGRDVLEKITEATPRWHPERQNAAAFFESIRHFKEAIAA